MWPHHFVGGWLSAHRQFLSKLLIRIINFSDLADKGPREQMVKLVEQMLSLPKKWTLQKSLTRKTRIHRQIDTTDYQIDRLEYELYGLTEKEIQIVEEGVK